MQTRQLGATGIEISAIGFGTWALGSWKPGMLSYGVTDDATSLAALRAGLDNGITFYDTARLYGLGHAEELLGQAFGQCRDQVVIGTKLGYLDFQGNRDFSPSFLTKGLEESLQRLRSDYVDLLQLHDPLLSDLQQDPMILETLLKLKRSGKARAIGVSTKSPEEALEMIGLFPFDAVEVNLNMMDLRADQCGLLAATHEKSIGVIARTPLCFGFLTGTIGPDATFPETDHRHRWSREQIRRWAEGAQKLLTIAGNESCSTNENIQNALRFCLGWPSVSTVIPGMLTPQEVPANATAGSCGALDNSVMAEITAAYGRLELFAR